MFNKFTRGLIGLQLNHLWQGHGSAIFLEFGKLTPSIGSDGSHRGLNGEMGVMIEWSWRIEGKKSIICGSWSDDDKWETGFKLLRNKTLASASVFGRLPEIDLEFNNGAHCLSFMTTYGQPAWAILDRRNKVLQTLHVRNGQIEIEMPEGPKVSLEFLEQIANNFIRETP
jgi:hypothetical protein